MDLIQKQEIEIKTKLLPYQCFLKVTEISSFVDDAPLIPEVIPEPQYGWRELTFECEYEGYPTNI